MAPSSPPLHGLPVGIKDLEDTGGLRTTYGSPLFRDHVPAEDERRRRRGPGRRRHRPRQDQHAGVRRRRQHAQRRLRRDRQPVRPAAILRRLVRRVGGGAGHRHGADLHRLRHRRLAAQSRRRSAASSASAPRRAWSPATSAASAGATCRCSARWRAPSPTLCLHAGARSCRTTAATRWRPRCMAPRSAAPRTSIRRRRSTCPACAWRSPLISALRRPNA